MKKLLFFSICSLLSFSTAFGQYFNVSHLLGSQVINGVTVTVTPTGSANSIPYCGVNPYWIGAIAGLGTYTFTFSQPVYAIRAEVTAMNDGELTTFDVNGAPYPLSPGNISTYLGTCGQAQATLNFGGLWGPPGTPNQPGIGGQVDIEDCNGITSVAISNNGMGNGATFSFYFSLGATAVTAGSNSPICVGQNINLTASNVTNGVYSWTGPGGFTSNQQNPTINNATAAMSGNYIVIVSAVGTCAPDTDTVNVQVLPIPVISSTVITNPSTCGGTDGSITLTGLTPNSVFTVTYDVNGNPISTNITSDGSGNVIISGLTQGNYTNIILTNGAGCASGPTSGTLTDPPIPAAPTITSNSPVCETYTINLGATTVPGGTFTWSGPAGFSSNQQNPAIPNAQQINEGNYSATVTVANCVSPSTTIFVDILPTPPPPTTANIDYCQFDIATPLTATGTALLWYTSQTGVGSATAPTPSTATAAATTYWVSQTVGGCESPKAPLVVNVKPQPTAPLYTGPVHYCHNDPSTPLQAAGMNLQWYDNNNVLLAGAPTPSTSVPGDFTWYVTQTVNGCESPKTTIIIHVAAIPPAPGTVDLTYCQYAQAVPLTANGQNLKWYNTQTGSAPLINTPVPLTDQPGTRTWWVSQTVDGCEGPTAPITVTVLFLPTSTFVASRPLVCENDTLTFTYTGTGTVAETYAWTWTDDSTILISGATNTAGPIVVRFDETGNYPITLNVDNQGCNTTTTYNVRVVPIPEATISMAGDVCIHDSVKVGLGSYNQPLYEYTWNFDGGVNLFNAVNEGPYQVQWNVAGLHIVDVTVGNTACASVFHDTVLVHANPSAQFTLAEAGNSICIGDSLRLAAIDNNGLYSYEWAPYTFFNQSNNYAPVVNAYARAAENVTLTVTTPWGCQASETVFIDAQGCCNVALPNAFTPNGDGKNDIFRPITQGNHAIKQFSIYDRWGKLVYENADIKKGWDGTFNGEDQDIGTFYYILRYICEGKTMDMKGEVILLR